MDNDIMNMRWHVVGAPWLQSDLMPYIVAGNEDPHVGVPVVDVIDLEDWDPDAPATEESCPHEIAEHIVELHNNWLDTRDARRQKSDG